MNVRPLVALLGGAGLLLVGGAALAKAFALPLHPKLLVALSLTGAGFLLVALTTWATPGACDSATPALRRRYLREFVPPMVAYVLVLFASVWLLKRLPEPGVPRALVALAPVLPIAIALRAIVRYVRDLDELQQRIELEAVSIASALVSLAYLAAGFLQVAKVIDIAAADAMIWVFPLICFTYGVAKAVVARRFS